MASLIPHRNEPLADAHDLGWDARGVSRRVLVEVGGGARGVPTPCTCPRGASVRTSPRLPRAVFPRGPSWQARPARPTNTTPRAEAEVRLVVCKVVHLQNLVVLC